MVCEGQGAVSEPGAKSRAGGDDTVASWALAHRLKEFFPGACVSVVFAVWPSRIAAECLAQLPVVDVGLPMNGRAAAHGGVFAVIGSRPNESVASVWVELDELQALANWGITFCGKANFVRGWNQVVGELEKGQAFHLLGRNSYGDEDEEWMWPEMLELEETRTWTDP